jgi:mono/diheme cytochrome c family protein
VKRLVLLVLVFAAAASAFALDRGVQRSTAAPRAIVTWDAVAPLFAAKCAGCHQEGGIAPFSLTSAQTAHKYAPLILQMTQANEMPPWMPGADSPAYLH